MDVNQQFDRECDQDEYERKIANLVINASEHGRKESPEKYEGWQAAVRILEKEDHYILVMINSPMISGRSGISGPHARFDQLKLFIVGLSIVVVWVGFPFLRNLLAENYRSTLAKYLPSREGRFFYLLVIGLFVAVAYLLGWLRVGDDRTGDGRKRG